MECLPTNHIIKINYDISYACDVCGYIFTDQKYLGYSREYRQMSVLFKSLKVRFGKNWKYEWYRLRAARVIVRSIRLQPFTADAHRMKLNEWKMYTLDDFPSFGNEEVTNKI